MPIYIVWAYSPTSDTLAFHGPTKGFTQVTLIPGMTPMTMMTMIPTPTAGEVNVIALIVFFLREVNISNLHKASR